jgi:hypothetical protein
MTAPRPYRSKLQPFEAEIAAMRHKRSPTPYREIVKFLKERYGLGVQLSTLANFVKVRSKGKRNSYLFGPPDTESQRFASSAPEAAFDAASRPPFQQRHPTRDES